VGEMTCPKPPSLCTSPTAKQQWKVVGIHAKLSKNLTLQYLPVILALTCLLLKCPKGNFINLYYVFLEESEADTVILPKVRSV